MRYSLSILKPDCLERGMVEVVRSIIERDGFAIILEKKLRLKQEDVVFIYEQCRYSDFFEGLTEFMLSGDVVVLVVRCNNDVDAVKKLNRLVGHTDPKLARVGTIRYLGESVRRNLAHSSADESAFRRELKRLFTLSEICVTGLG